MYDQEKSKLANFFEDKNTRRLCTMIVMVLSYCFAEIIVGYKTGSLALIADSFHMLSDSLSLVVALYGIRLSGMKRQWSGIYNTYGWGRSQILTTLINAVFLIALCVTIALDAIERIVEPQQVENPKFVFWVGLGGLIVNILGLVLFGEQAHGHSHGGGGGHSHSHSHDHTSSSSHSHSHNHAQSSSEPQHSHSHSSTKSIHQIVEEDCADCSTQNLKHKSSHGHSHENMNIYAVYLHIFGDFLGSIVVMCTSGALIWLGKDQALKRLSNYEDPNSSNQTIGVLETETPSNFSLRWNKLNFYHYQAVYDGNRSELQCARIEDLITYDPGNKQNDGSILWEANPIWGCYGVKNDTDLDYEIFYQEPEWTTWIDPICSLILVVIIVCLTYPVVRKPMLILMQTLPDGVNEQKLKHEILDTPGVLAVHCLHV